MSFRGPRYIAFLGLFFAFSAVLGWGQATTSILGTVTDPSGAVIPGVSVTLENTGTAATRTTITDETGTYQILQVQPGTYRIRAELSGFKTVVRENLQLVVNTPVTLDLKFESLSRKRSQERVGGPSQGSSPAGSAPRRCGASPRHPDSAGGSG